MILASQLMNDQAQAKVQQRNDNTPSTNDASIVCKVLGLSLACYKHSQLTIAFLQSLRQ
jgi:hypothetical protein